MQGTLYLNGDFFAYPEPVSGFDTRFQAENEIGKKERRFRISPALQRKAESMGVCMQMFHDHRPKTFCLTFPRDPEDTSPMINRFLTNAKKTYGVKQYIWFRELTKKGREHFHFMVDMPYTNIDKFNRAWNRASGMKADHSLRSLETIKDHRAAVNYGSKAYKVVTDYFTKNNKEEQYKRDGLTKRLFSASSHLQKDCKVIIKNPETVELAEHLAVKTNRYAANGIEFRFSKLGHRATLDVLSEFAYME